MMRVLIDMDVHASSLEKLKAIDGVCHRAARDMECPSKLRGRSFRIGPRQMIKHGKMA